MYKFVPKSWREFLFPLFLLQLAKMFPIIITSILSLPRHFVHNFSPKSDYPYLFPCLLDRCYFFSSSFFSSARFFLYFALEKTFKRKQSTVNYEYNHCIRYSRLVRRIYSGSHCSTFLPSLAFNFIYYFF